MRDLVEHSVPISGIRDDYRAADDLVVLGFNRLQQLIDFLEQPSTFIESQFAN